MKTISAHTKSTNLIFRTLKKNMAVRSNSRRVMLLTLVKQEPKFFVLLGTVRVFNLMSRYLSLTLGRTPLCVHIIGTQYEP